MINYPDDHDPDFCPKQDRIERLIDEADYRHTERRDREMEKMWEKQEAAKKAAGKEQS